MRVRHKLFIIISFFIILGICIGTGWLWHIVRPAIHKDIINKYAGEYKFDPLLIMALVKIESNFVKHARSRSGAIGLMQLLPSTAEELAGEIGLTNFSLSDLEKPDINVRLGFHYLAKLRRQSNGDIIQMLAAYNAGFSTTLQWKKNNTTLNIVDISFKETRLFVQNVLETYEWLKKFQKIKDLVEIT